jgi:hypothetical protein
MEDIVMLKARFLERMNINTNADNEEDTEVALQGAIEVMESFLEACLESKQDIMTISAVTKTLNELRQLWEEGFQ